MRIQEGSVQECGVGSHRAGFLLFLASSHLVHLLCAPWHPTRPSSFAPHEFLASLRVGPAHSTVSAKLYQTT